MAKDNIRAPLLTVADALQYCADQLRKEQADNRMISAIMTVVKDRPELLNDAPASVKAAMVQPEKQDEVLATTIKLLQDLVVEHRVLAMKEASSVKSL